MSRGARDPLAMEAAATQVLMGKSSKETHEEARSEESKEEPRGEKKGRKRSTSTGGFEKRSDGIYHVGGEHPVRLCGPLEIVAQTRSAASNEWGRLLRWRDEDGVEHQWAMPIKMTRADEYRGYLMDAGLYVNPAQRAREHFVRYLQTQGPDTRVTCVSRVGWHDRTFVFPDTCIQAAGAERVIYQTESESDHRHKVRGTSADWRERIGTLCSGNSRLILAVSCAFTGPLLELVGQESGGIHLVGDSSSGKTTALLVGGSVCGGGGKNGYAETWETTKNGLEGTAEVHNDLLLVLDEIGQLDPREAADTAYMLANGLGKTRMTRTIGLRRRLNWRLLFLSSGELTLADHAASAGKRTRGGAEVRLLNIGADAGAGMGLFENLHDSHSPNAFADLLKERTQNYYGAPIRTFLEKLVQCRPEVVERWTGYRAAFISEYVPEDASGEVKRAAGRLALVAYGGEVATSWGLTGWEPDEPRHAAATAFASWMHMRGGTGPSESETAVRQVRRFIETNGSARFELAKRRVDRNGDEFTERIVNRAGYRQVSEKEVVSEYWLLPETWRVEVCAGMNHSHVARVLRDKGFLHCESPSLMRKVRVWDHEDLIWVYAVRPNIIIESKCDSSQGAS